MENGNKVIELDSDHKGIKEYFVDWYDDTFGFGYGTGDKYFCKALTQFFHAQKVEKHTDYTVLSYDYEELEKIMGAAEAWFTINALCKDGLIEYGTSPRFGWLTDSGKLMWKFLLPRTASGLYELVTHDSDYIPCTIHYCNHTDLKEQGCKLNPFWYAPAAESFNG